MEASSRRRQMMEISMSGKSSIRVLGPQANESAQRFGTDVPAKLGAVAWRQASCLP